MDFTSNHILTVATEEHRFGHDIRANLQIGRSTRVFPFHCAESCTIATAIERASDIGRLAFTLSFYMNQ